MASPRCCGDARRRHAGRARAEAPGQGDRRLLVRLRHSEPPFVEIADKAEAVVFGLAPTRLSAAPALPLFRTV